MKNRVRLVWLALGISFACGAFAAMDETDKRYVDRLAKGGPQSIREVGESLFQSGNTNTEVLDVAAEVLLTKYQGAEDRGNADAMAWLCKALGGSGNNRYKAAVDQVAEKAENRKLRGHCEKASKGLPKGATNTYTAGMVNLELIRNPPPAPAPVVAAVPAAAKGAKPAAGGKPAAGAKPAAAAAPVAQPAPAVRSVDLSLVREGMSSQEVNEILGPPTNTSSHMTGKQFKPFNFGAKDTQRMYYLYKGVGRIEFSLKSAYEGIYRVISVKPDPSETGYP